MMKIILSPKVEKMILKKNTKGLIKMAGALNDKNKCLPAIYALGQIGDGAAVGTLVNALNYKDRQISEASAEALVKIGSPAVAPLIMLLEYFKSFVLENAIFVLGQIGDARAAAPIVNYLGSQEYLTRSEAEKALIKIGNPAIESLISSLRPENTDSEAINILGMIGDARAIGPLADLRRSKNARIRWRAVSALGNIGGNNATKEIKKFIKDSDVEVRTQAATALKRVGWEPEGGELEAWYWISLGNWDKVTLIGSEAIDPLKSILQNYTLDRKIRGESAKALGNIENPAIVSLLLSALRDVARCVRQAGLNALIKIGNPAVNPLIDTLTEIDTAHLAIEALGEIGDIRAIEPLTKLFKHENTGPNNRARIVEALGKINHPQIIDPLIEALTDENEAVFLGAIKSLAVIYKSGSLSAKQKQLILQQGNKLKRESKLRHHSDGHSCADGDINEWRVIDYHDDFHSMI
jgi:HEAT repeat protein